MSSCTSDNLLSNITVEQSSINSINDSHVNIRFTIALAVPAGKF